MPVSNNNSIINKSEMVLVYSHNQKFSTHDNITGLTFTAILKTILAIAVTDKQTLTPPAKYGLSGNIISQQKPGRNATLLRRFKRVETAVNQTKKHLDILRSTKTSRYFFFQAITLTLQK